MAPGIERFVVEFEVFEPKSGYVFNRGELEFSSSVLRLSEWLEYQLQMLKRMEQPDVLYGQPAKLVRAAQLWMVEKDAWIPVAMEDPKPKDAETATAQE